MPELACIKGILVLLPFRFLLIELSVKFIQLSLELVTSLMLLL